MLLHWTEPDAVHGHWEHPYTRELRQAARILGTDDAVRIRLFQQVLRETGATMVTPISQIWPSILIG